MAHLVVVCGPTGSGKSYWTRQAIANSSRLIVVDPMGEYDVGGVAVGLEASLTRILQLQRMKTPRFRLSCRVPTKAAAAGAPSPADEVVRAVWGWQTDYANPDPAQMITLVIDEVDRISAPRDRDTGVDIMANYGRRVADPLYVCCRRLSKISRDVTANAKRPGGIVMFGFDEPGDMDALKKRKGDDAVEKVLALGKYECAVF